MIPAPNIARDPSPATVARQLLWTAAPVLRRASAYLAGPWDERLLCCQEWEWYVRVMVHVHAAAKLPAPQAVLRRHSGPRITSQRTLSGPHIMSKAEASVAVYNTLRMAGVLDVGVTPPRPDVY